ncbi:hypothetical protein TNCV_1410201 [Trichonephila clavipes]|nr:hypothetical protein TNCV_1410201 [Trichonephila clavipes]
MNERVVLMCPSSMKAYKSSMVKGSCQKVDHLCCIFKDGRQTVEVEGRGASTNGNNIAPPYFHLLYPLKVVHLDSNFQNNAEMEQAVRQFLASKDTCFYQSGFFKVIVRNDKCVKVGGNHVEK